MLGVFVSLTAILAAASIQPARADTWDVPFLGDRIQVKAHPDNPEATFTASDHAGDTIDIPESSGCDTLPCGFDKPEGARFVTVESEDPIFVVSRTNQGRLLPTFRRSPEPPDCEARRESDENSFGLARRALTALFVVNSGLPEGSEQRTEYEAAACSLWSKTLASARTSLAGCMVSEDRNREIGDFRNTPSARHCEPTDGGSRSPYIWNVPFIGTTVSVQATPGVNPRKNRIRVIADNREDTPLDVLDDCRNFPCGFTRPAGTKFLRIESDDPLFVAARSGDNATGRTFPVYRSAPDWQDCATRQADDRAFLEESSNTLEVLQDAVRRVHSSYRSTTNAAICRLAKDSLALLETNLGSCPAWDGRSGLRTVFDRARRRTPGCYSPPRPPTPPPPPSLSFPNPTAQAHDVCIGSSNALNFDTPTGGAGTYRYIFELAPHPSTPTDPATFVVASGAQNIPRYNWFVGGTTAEATFTLKMIAVSRDGLVGVQTMNTRTRTSASLGSTCPTPR